MSEPYYIKKLRSEDPSRWITTSVICSVCSNCWVAVVPGADVPALECPSCNSFSGVPRPDRS